MSGTAGIPARRAALSLLEAVLDKGRGLDEAAPEALAGLDARDRGFARRLALTALRRKGQTDALLKHWLARPPAGKARRIVHVLRLGLAQLLFLEDPPHAAVDSAVALSQAVGQPKMAGLTNAVLRRAVREGPDLLATQDAARLNTPDWLWRDWEAGLGVDTARAIAAVQLDEPPTDLCVPNDPDGWAMHLGGVRIGAQTVRLSAPGDITALPGFAEGAWWVQDAAATLPVRLLGDVSGRRVIDLCAAPGGKTAQLAAAGAAVTALDRSASRLERLRENLTRLSLKAEIIEADAETWRPKDRADAILLDAPCSATGTLRRHPEIAYRRGPGDVEKLAALQRRLLATAVEMLAPGGVLVVATCSLQSAEGPMLAAFGDTLADLSREPIHTEMLPSDWAAAVTPDGALRTHPAMLPGQGGADGFFAVRYRRR